MSLATINLQINPVLKETLRIAAMREQRCIGNMMEVLTRKHCDEVGISIPEQQALFKDTEHG